MGGVREDIIEAIKVSEGQLLLPGDVTLNELAAFGLSFLQNALVNELAIDVAGHVHSEWKTLNTHTFLQPWTHNPRMHHTLTKPGSNVQE